MPLPRLSLKNMDQKQFLIECNKSPLLREYRPVHLKTLKEVGFSRKNYRLDDLRALELLLFFLPPAVVPLQSVKLVRQGKDFIHAELLKKFDNKKLVRETRHSLKMPHANKGFQVINRDGALPGFTNVDFATIEPAYQKWFFHWTEGIQYPGEFERLLKTTSVVHREISKAIKLLLKKWELPQRYFQAVQELVLFNTIIPATSGITFHYESGYPSGEPRISISIDIDTTKEDLIDAIKEDFGQMFVHRERFLPGKVRKTKRKKTETDKMLVIYNHHKKEGKKDKDIFSLIQNVPEFRHLSLSAIRDRIKDS